MWVKAVKLSPLPCLFPLLLLLLPLPSLPLDDAGLGSKDYHPPAGAPLRPYREVTRQFKHMNKLTEGGGDNVACYKPRQVHDICTATTTATAAAAGAGQGGGHKNVGDGVTWGDERKNAAPQANTHHNSSSGGGPAAPSFPSHSWQLISDQGALANFQSRKGVSLCLHGGAKRQPTPCTNTLSVHRTLLVELTPAFHGSTALFELIM
jgi:hypothetical protein